MLSKKAGQLATHQTVGKYWEVMCAVIYHSVETKLKLHSMHSTIVQQECVGRYESNESNGWVMGRVRFGITHVLGIWRQLGSFGFNTFPIVIYVC